VTRCPTPSPDAILSANTRLASGVPDPGAVADLDAAGAALSQAQAAESDARRRLEQAQDDLERAQRRGERAEKDAEQAARTAAQRRRMGDRQLRPFVLAFALAALLAPLAGCGDDENPALSK
jgi:hypothetical protein